MGDLKVNSKFLEEWHKEQSRLPRSVECKKLTIRLTDSEYEDLNEFVQNKKYINGKKVKKNDVTRIAIKYLLQSEKSSIGNIFAPAL